MIEGMSPRVKLERKTASTKFVAVNGERIQRCIAIRSVSLVKLFISMQKVVRSVDEKNPLI